MAFTWFDKFTETLKKIPTRADQDALIVAIVRYGALDEDPELSFPYDAMFAGFEDDITNSIKSRTSGAQGGSKGGRKTPTKGGSKGGRKTPTEAPAEGGEVTQTNTSQDNTGQDKTDSYAVSFALRCLSAFNEVKGTTYSSMPAVCARTLERFDGTYTVEEVKAMVAYKVKEWTGTKYKNALTPNGLFHPDHFEQYMHQAKEETEEVEQYAKYDA